MHVHLKVDAVKLESMFTEVKTTIQSLNYDTVSLQRKKLLSPLIQYIQSKINLNKSVQLIFICTHNSRRSHLAQIWAQAMAAHFHLKNVACYSGGTEVTALYPKVIETLKRSGFKIEKKDNKSNPIYHIQYSQNNQSILASSKQYNHPTNPSTDFAAILTCSHADQNCPFIAGAEERIPIPYDDPKLADDTSLQDEVYFQRSRQIANEMYYVFNQLKINELP